MLLDPSIMLRINKQVLCLPKTKGSVRTMYAQICQRISITKMCSFNTFYIWYSYYPYKLQWQGPGAAFMLPYCLVTQRFTGSSGFFSIFSSPSLLAVLLLVLTQTFTGSWLQSWDLCELNPDCPPHSPGALWKMRPWRMR